MTTWNDYCKYDSHSFPRKQGLYDVELKDGTFTQCKWNGHPIGFGKSMNNQIARWKDVNVPK